ncbi:hypothetical protein SLH46_06480 [Draconibacterium sp. IB214405]|uniref:hypothetical protein n=1 Tax=Draconibacterium sp. IB214405 TaxID=3097352 RepID=UPI002A14D215|nr:hypothetical protein [Draconibacterium sp. IB214405]MDX8338819.1 hypothetical protein [Draconibacterium sp. IB214405]
MSKALKILLLVVWALTGVTAHAQNKVKNELVLFADRDFCISGDTLWVKVFVPEGVHQFGNIVHLQLESQSGNLISTGAIKRGNSHAEGFIAVPDSLQTGLYFVHAFLNAQRNTDDLECIGRAVYVYNRFEESIEQLPVLRDKSFLMTPATNGKTVNISADQSNYTTRDEVKGAINVPGDEFVFVVASARMIDPFSKANTGFLNFKMKDLTTTIPAFTEKDGVVVSGNISDKASGNPAKELVLLSVAGNGAYLDYYYPDSSGVFHFFLPRAMGNANIILQPLTVGETLFDINVTPVFMTGVQQLKFDTTFVNPVQAQTIENSIKGTFFNKLFYGVSIRPDESFEMPNPYGMPFYGWPDNHVVPDNFIDLPDFQEISRELLIGLQYRDRNDEVTFRILNYAQDRFFTKEPLRLINGIPVFKNSFFQNLKSTEIEYIDLVKTERVFGDLRFKGVLSVALKDKSNGWLAQQPNIFQLSVPCVQYTKHVDYKAKVEGLAQPDTRQQFFNEMLEESGSWPFRFQLSDVKGELEIRVEAITKSGELYRTSKIIAVQ